MTKPLSATGGKYKYQNGSVVDENGNKVSVDVNGKNIKDNLKAQESKNSKAKIASDKLPLSLRKELKLDSDGYNDKGCSLQGVRRDGTVCDYQDIPKVYKNGKDQFGFDEKTKLNDKGCDFYGYKEDGVTLCSKQEITRVGDVVDQFNVNMKTGLNQNNCDFDNKKPDGSPCEVKNRIRFVSKKTGRDQFGLKSNGFNENGCSLDGFDTNGNPCEFENITRIVDEKTQKDQLGFNDDGFNDNDCNIKGLNRQGEPCEPDKITRIFNKDNVDQFGLNASGYSKETGCNLLGYDKNGKKCKYDDIPKILSKNGVDQLGYSVLTKLNSEGKDWEGFYQDGCDDNFKNKEGKSCSFYEDVTLTANEENYLKSKEKVISDYIKEVSSPSERFTELSLGTYNPDSTVGENIEKIKEQAKEIEMLAESEKYKQKQEKTNSKNESNSVVNIPMGFMAKVFIKTPVNTDYTDDVYATIIGTELDGAELKGKVVTPYINDPVMPRDKFYYLFDRLMYKRKSYPISATSISLDNESSMIDGDDVDYHVIQRYGGLILNVALSAGAATYLDSEQEQAYKAQAEAVATALTGDLNFGTNALKYTKQNLKTAQEYLSEIAMAQFSRKPTIKKGKNIALIIFKEEVVNPELPVVYEDL
jgi:hypothetical protein